MMKKFLAILILIFTLQTPSQADDIIDFQIEGMSIGDSALEYYTESKINSYEKEYYKNRDTTAAIKRGLYGLIYIQKNLGNDSHDKIKKTSDQCLKKREVINIKKLIRGI